MVEDLEFLTEPFVGTTEMVYVPHLQFYRTIAESNSRNRHGLATIFKELNL